MTKLNIAFVDLSKNLKNGERDNSFFGVDFGKMFISCKKVDLDYNGDKPDHYDITFRDDKGRIQGTVYSLTQREYEAVELEGCKFKHGKLYALKDL